jgi:hypothetical protein
MQLFEGSWKYSVFFHLCYWLCRGYAAKTFETYRNIHRDSKGYWCSSMVSTFHAVLITYLSVRALILDPKLRTGADFFYNTETSLLACRIFYGYIFNDLLLSVYYRSRWPGYIANLVHHTTIMITWSIFLLTGSGQYLAMIAHLCELTTPFINQRWFLYEAGLKSSKVYFYNGLAMVFLWFVTRIVIYSYCGWVLISNRAQMVTLGYAPALMISFCYSAGLFLQFMWFFKMVKGAIKSLKAQSEGQDDKEVKKEK